MTQTVSIQKRYGVQFLRGLTEFLADRADPYETYTPEETVLALITWLEARGYQIERARDDSDR